MGQANESSKKVEYLPPIIVTHESGKTRIECDEVITDFPDNAVIPTEASPLACRIFRALMCDIEDHLRAE